MIKREPISVQAVEGDLAQAVSIQCVFLVTYRGRPDIRTREKEGKQ